jgi:pilus assembly protein Flp/PilA
MSTIEFMRAWIQTKVRNERAATLVEYALLVALIAVVCVAAVTTLGEAASENFSSISDSL